MSPSRLITSVSLLAAASAAGYWLLSPPPQSNQIPAATGNRNPQEITRKTTWSIGGPTASATARPSTLPPTHGASASGHPSQAHADHGPAGTAPTADSRSGSRRSAPPSAPSSLSREELKARAARVEQDANHELRRLVTLLDLSPDQQDQIFQTLASRSPHWVPGMATTSGPDSTASGRSRDSKTAPGTTPSPMDASRQPSPSPSTAASTPSPEESDPLASILPYLTPEQQEALITDEMDRAAWWEEMIPVLLPDDTPPPVTSAPDIKEFTGPDTLD